MPLPLLVIIAGAPASGKTTLADRLSEELQLALIHRDAITEALADILRPTSRDGMEPITQASFRAFYALVSGHLARGSGVVCETNFGRGLAEAELRPIIAHARAVLINCKVGRELSIQRFIDRFEWGERHWCYFDEERIEEIHAGGGLEAWDQAQPLDLDIPSLDVDTTDGYKPDLEAIVAFIPSAAAMVVPTEAAADRNGTARQALVCPKLGFMDNPPEHYSHPTHLHRCYAGVSPIRLATQQQRDLCLTEGHVSCPRLAGVYEPRVRASTAAPRPAALAAFEAALAQQRHPEPIASDPPAPPPALRALSDDDADWLTPDGDAALVERQPQAGPSANPIRKQYLVRGGVAVSGFIIGVGLAAIALLAVFGGNLLQDDADLARVAASTPAARPTTVLRIPAEFLATPEPTVVEPGPSTAGIQQPAPGPATAEPTAVPLPTQQPPPTAAPQVRLATIRAPAGFNSANLREAPATTARTVSQLTNGTSVEVLDGTAAGDGFTWARIRTQDGTAGWIVTTAVAG